MAKIRVYELARQLNTTNQVLLEKLREMNIPVKSHMSGIEETVVPLLKEALFGNKAEVVVERRVRGTVIRRRKKVVKKPVQVEETSVADEWETAAVSEPAESGVPVQEEAGPTEGPQTVESSDQASLESEAPLEEEAITEEARVSSEGSETATHEEVKITEEEKPSKKVKRKKREKPAKIIRLPEKGVVDIPESEAPAGLEPELGLDESGPAPQEVVPPPEEAEACVKDKKDRKRRHPSVQ